MTKTKKPKLPNGRPPLCKNCHQPKNPKCKCGHPSAFTKERVKKLVDAFHQSFTVDDACKIARISTSAYYDECKRNPTFLEEMELAQLWPEMIIRSNLVKTAAYDADLGLKYLERKRKAEWSPRVETQSEHVHHFKPLSERAIQLLRKYNGGKDPLYTRATQKVITVGPGGEVTDEGEEE